MLDHPYAKALAIAFFCGMVAFAATTVRRRQLPPGDRSRHSLSPIRAGLTAMIGALLGIAIALR